ncbi:YbfB/YjiJ family MFS transporter [Pseudorhodoferax sp. Leaf267]|uniref:YbfB/YjiJ family MFS transporter n=1 Tax=Pseudorhodoferax sp. Leaf267 TaxID=1736316 RepID=UPI0009E6EB86|nr:YbfB/YjiJ family MFS transporter [Pseudorhodoferax sp. Leaf267]
MSPTTIGPWAIAVTGALALATAMGIGRFAFTPLLPMMLHDGVLDLAGASWLASANYLGYLVGAVLCMLQPWIWRRIGNPPPPDPAAMVRGGLVATTLLTLAMALPWPALWPTLRFAAGVASACVFVYISGWCLTQTARRGRAALGGMIYTGPGTGIVLSGLIASLIVAWQGSAQLGWLVFGVLAAVLTLGVRPVLLRGTLPAAAAAGTGPMGGTPAAAGHGEVALLIAGYGCAGFGYIITATFLPVIARQALPGSPWLDLFWPIFGAGVMVGAMLTTRVSLALDMRHLLAGCHVVQALGVLASLVSPSLAGFVLGSVLLGVPFTAITYFAMQEIRRLRPLHAASTMGLATALYGIGQVAGPPLVALLIAWRGSAAQGFTLSLAGAAGTLLLGAGLYLWSARRYPKTRA